MAHQKSNIEKYRKPVRLNIGAIIFAIIFIYIGVNVVLYLSKEHISIYEVIHAEIADNNDYTGIILREETVYYSEKAGYLNYFIGDGARASKNAIIYTLDETGSVHDQLSEMEYNKEDAKKVQTEMKNRLYQYHRDNDASIDFLPSYTLKADISDAILNITASSMLSNADSLIGKYSDANSFHVVKTEESGLISYMVDGYESKTSENIIHEDFNTENYSKQLLFGTELVEKGGAVYKLISSENWSIVTELTKEQFEKLAERTSVEIVLKKSGIHTWAAIETYQKGESYFACLNLKRFLVEYCEERFLEFEIILNSASGYKIPNSAIIEKNFFKIPLEYFTSGGDSSTNGLIQLSYSEKGEPLYTYYSADIYYKDEEYGYISASEHFAAGDMIVSATDNSQQYQITLTDALKGVYNVNKGYCIFRRIEVIYENEEYSLVSMNTLYGLSEYDHIVLQGNLAVDQAIIY